MLSASSCGSFTDLLHTSSGFECAVPGEGSCICSQFRTKTADAAPDPAYVRIRWQRGGGKRRFAHEMDCFVTVCVPGQPDVDSQPQLRC